MDQYASIKSLTMSIFKLKGAAVIFLFLTRCTGIVTAIFRLKCIETIKGGKKTKEPSRFQLNCRAGQGVVENNVESRN